MYKVLLVDDEVYVRKGLRNLIDWNGSGFEISGEAEKGKEAFEWIERYSPVQQPPGIAHSRRLLFGLCITIRD